MNSFTITAPDKKVKLNTKGPTVVPITVTNISKKAVRGTPKLKAMGGAAESWFALRNGATVMFPPETSEQFQVEIKVPAGTRPGEYTFGLNVSNEARPEDDFAEGPPVAFELESTIIPPPPPPSRWWIWALIAAVVVGGGVTTWLLMPKPPPPPPPPPPPQKAKVPKLIGLHPNKLSEQRQDLIYRKADEEHTGKQPAGHIAEQDPNPDVEVEPGNVVLYTVEAQSPLVGSWLPAGTPSSTVARYVISQKGTQMFVRVFEKGSPNPVDRGEVEAARSDNRLAITWRGPTIMRAVTPKLGARALAPIRTVHQQTLTVTGDGRLLVEEGTSKFTFERERLNIFQRHRVDLRLRDAIKVKQ